MLVIVLALGGMVWAQSVLLINGAGATFPAPIYSKWFDEFHKANGTQIKLSVGVPVRVSSRPPTVLSISEHQTGP